MGLFDFLTPKPKHIFNENGENIVFFDKKEQGIKLKFYKKQGKLDGKFFDYYLQSYTGGELLPCVKANFVEGKINGICSEYSISGQCDRVVEKYDKGSLINQKIFLTGFSSRGKLHRENSFKKEDNEKGIIQNIIEEHSIKYKF